MIKINLKSPTHCRQQNSALHTGNAVTNNMRFALRWMALVLVLLGCGVKAQMSQWIIPNKKINFSTNSISTITPPNISSVIISNVANGAYDQNGNLLFYVYNSQVFNAQGTFIKDLSYFRVNNTSNHSHDLSGEINYEIAIVPVPNNCNKFYVIHTVNQVQGDPTNGAIGMGTALFYTTVDCTNPSNITADALNTVLNTSSTGFTDPHYFPSYAGNYSAIAIGKILPNNTRYLYVTRYDGIDKYIINNTGIVFANVFANTQTTGFSSIGGYSFSSYQLELNPAQNTLAFFSPELYKIIVVPVNTTNGNVNGSPTLISTTNRCIDLEFDPTTGSSKIFATLATSVSSANALVSIVGSTTTTIPNTSQFNKTNLEAGIDGKIYLVKTQTSNPLLGDLYKLDPSNNSISLVVPAGGGSIVLNNSVCSGPLGAANLGIDYFKLPEQIDGELYDNFMFPSITSTSANQYFCAGTTGTATLTASGNGTFNWTIPPSNTVIGTGASINVVIPTSNTTYQVTATTPSGCTVSATQTIYINPIPVLNSIVGPITKCATNPVYVALPQTTTNSATYNWSIANSGSFTTTSSSSVSGIANWSSATLNVNGTISATLSQTIGGTTCTSPQCSLTVKPCCAPQITQISVLAFYNQDQQPGSPWIIYNQSSNLPSAIISTLASTTAKTVKIDNIFTVNSTLVMNNADIWMGLQAKIVILSGAKLKLDNNSLVRAYCGQMWDRIEIQAGGELEVLGASTIQDGENAIVSNGGGIFKIYGGSVLNKNYKHITVNTFNGNHLGFIKNSTIKCRATATTLTNDELIAPYSGQNSAVGVEINSVTAITIGEPTFLQTNTFDNMNVGIASNRSNFTVYNNILQNIQGTHSTYSCPCSRGTAICGEGVSGGQSVKTATIGGSLYKANFIHDCGTAIDLKTCIASNVINNSIYRIAGYGVAVKGNISVGNDITITDNHFDDVQSTNIALTNNSTASKFVNNNFINTSGLTLTNALATAIVISDVTSISAASSVNNNQIAAVKSAILINGANRFTIANNNISLNTAPFVNAQSAGAGIKVVNAANTNINSNTITAANRDNWWVDGIRVSNCIGNIINCNYMYKTASGLFFDGNCTPTAIYKNNMRRNYWGLLVNWGMIGNQYINSGITYASDNIWTGPYLDNSSQYYHTNCLGNSNAANSILNVRNSSGTPYLPNPFYSMGLGNNFIDPFYNTVQTSSNLINTPCTLLVAEDLTVGMVVTPGLIGGAQYHVTYSQAQWDWWLKHGLYLDAKHDPNLNLDPDLLAFKEKTDAEPLGKLVDIKEKLADTTQTDSASYENIKMLNDAIVPTNALEERYKELNNIAIRLRLAPDEKDVYTESQIASIREIANLCPLEFGPGVYMARALLNGVDTIPTEYMNDCEIAVPIESINVGRRGAIQPKPAVYSADEEQDLLFDENPDENPSAVSPTFAVKVFPNPANTLVNIQGLSKDEIASYQVFNSLGVLVRQNKISANNVEFSVSDFANGIYTIKICNSKGNITIQKLNVLH